MKRVLLASAMAVALSSSVLAADDQPDGLPPTIAALVESMGALTKSSGAVMDTRLTTVRAYKIRQQLTSYLLTGDLNALPAFPKDDILLCEPRKKQVILQASITYLNAVTAQVKATAKSDITADTDANNIIRAFKSLFVDYRIDVDTPDGTIEAKVEARCRDDLKGFAASYYALEPANEAAIVAAFAALYDIFKSIIAPIIVEGSRYIDEARRLEKIRQFLKSDANQKLITSNSANLRDALTNFEKARKGEGVGHFIEAQLALKSGFKKARAVEECKDLDSDPANRDVAKDAFRVCFAAIWAENKERIGAVTTAAARYDQVADIGAGEELKQLKVITDSLQKIAKNEDDPATFNSVWKAAMRLMSIAQKIETATSKDNREKIGKAVKDVVDAL